MAFAKLFGEDDNQVLVKIEQSDDGPEVRFFFKPEGLGVCSQAICFEDSDSGWDKAEDAFTKIDESMARKVAKNATDRILGVLCEA